MTKCIIGVDIGGSKINAVLFKNGKVFKSGKIATPKKSRAYFLNKLEKTIREVAPQSGKLLGIGCGIAGTLDSKKGTVLKSPNLKFLDGFDVKSWLEKKFKTAVKIDNDARCFLRGEYLFGAGRGYKNIIGITLGTGIGGAIIIGGKMVYGTNDSAGELGHMVIDRGKDLETLTVKQARRLNFSKTAVKEFEKNIKIGFSNVVNILDPEIIIIGGGAVKTSKMFLPKIKLTSSKFIISPKAQKNVKILISKLGEDAGAMGAAALFYES
jgi:glucokinase